LVRGQSVYSQLTVMRLASALLAALVALCAFGVVREILPGHPLAAVAAGLLVAFHPMFGFIGGAVNNDNGVNAAVALSLYLLVRALRRGLTPRLALALGATLALAPLMKETGYEVYPVALVALAGVLWRSRDGPGRLRPTGGSTAAAPTAETPSAALAAALAPWAALAVGFLLVRGGAGLLEPHMQDVFAGHATGGAAISATSAVSLARQMPGRFLVYLWELFLPRLSFMGALFPPGWPFFQIYMQRGWGAFGWYTFFFPRWVYVTILLTMVAVGLLALRAAWRHRPFVRGRGWELLVIVLLPLCVLLAVEAAYFTPTGGRTVVAEQGRYMFPAIAALAAIAVGGTFGLGRRLHVPLATALVVAMIGLSYAAQLLTLGSFFT
ncbi:MAG TPA: glycosyltransferase family 39 protein, partial [Solirubrobacteraceae bacterium]|nr:glycosyltransferase family 39 protein [Solirubrobacteraceae bacterium]